MFSIDDIIYHIGTNGPSLLVVVSIGILYVKTKYLTVFLVGSLLNLLTNYALKGIIAQPRPKDYMIHIEKKYRKILNYERYGMPSGHTQLAFFTTVFVYLATQNTHLLLGYLFVSIVVVYQRVAFEYHYFSQTVVGAIVGSVFAWLCFQYGIKVHKGQLTSKRDDFYFGLGSG